MPFTPLSHCVAMARRTCPAAALLALMCAPPPLSAQSAQPVLAVGGLESAVAGMDTRALQTALSTALARTRMFTIMESARLEALAEERGAFPGVDYLVRGRVLETAMGTSKAPPVRECVATVRLQLQVISRETGSSLLDESITHPRVIEPAALGGKPCAADSASEIDWLGREGADALASRVTMAIFPIKVARISDREVYLNYGEGSLRRGEMLGVSAQGSVARNIGGGDTGWIGAVSVTEVKGGFSIGRVLHGTRGLRVGDIMQRADPGLARLLGPCSAAEALRAQACSGNPESASCQKATAKADQQCAAAFN